MNFDSDPLNESKLKKKLRNFESDNEKNLRSFGCVKKNWSVPVFIYNDKNTIVKNFNS